MAEEHDLMQRINQRAYELWLEEGRPEGKAKDHWEKAKAEIKQEPAEPEDKPIEPAIGPSSGP